MDSERESKSSSLQRIMEEAIGNLDDSVQLSISVDFEYSGGTRTNSEATSSEVATSTTENSKSSKSEQTSEYSSDDFFGVDSIITPISRASDHNLPPKSKENTKPPLRDGKHDVCSGPLFQLEESIGFSRSSSQDSDVTHESFVQILSPTQSPPTQVMEKPRGFDPDRIPASIFTRPPSPMDWSAASNESLFSIQIGNSSFKLAGDSNKPNDIGRSGELYISKELYKPGELDESSELYSSWELKCSSDVIRSRQPSPVTRGGEHKPQIDLDKTGAFEKPKENLPKRTIRDEGEIKQNEANCRLDETRTNVPSFAFPVKKKSSKSSGICTNCSCKFCSCKWLCCSGCSNCSCKCPNCSGCSCNLPGCSRSCCQWQSCHCKRPCCSCKCLNWPSCSWKWSCLRSCCCKWPSCSSCCCKGTSGCC